MKRFREGRLTTGLIAEEFPDGFSGAVLDPYEEGALCAVAVAFERDNAERTARMSGQIAHHRKADVPTICTGREDRVNRRAEVTEDAHRETGLLAAQHEDAPAPREPTTEG